MKTAKLWANIYPFVTPILSMLKHSLHTKQGIIARVIAYEVLKLPHICMECGKEGMTDVHHKNGNRDDNSKDNLIILCRKHHMRLHDIFPPPKEIPLSQAPFTDKRFKDNPKKIYVQEKRRLATQAYREKWGIE